jgi:hypothetical protein
VPSFDELVIGSSLAIEMSILLAPADSAALLVDDDPVTVGGISGMRGVVQHP